MRISYGNQIKGIIVSIAEGAVTGIVALDIGNGRIRSNISMDAIKALNLFPGKQAYALISELNVNIAITKPIGISSPNQLKGRLISVTKGAVNGEVSLELDSGNKITAIVTNDSIAQLGLASGQTAYASFRANAVLIGVE